MPDGTVPSSTEALRAALTAARMSLERQISVARTDAAEDALRQVQSALRLLPPDRIRDIPEIAWIDADPQHSPQTPHATATVSDLDDVVRRDDLTRIRGIDDVLAQRLAALGIHRYAQIASWQGDDVRAIADAMGLGRRFVAAGVIEQAARLDRDRLAARDRHSQPASKPEDRYSIAAWEPTVSAASVSEPMGGTSPGAGAAALVRVPSSWRPLNNDERRQAIAAIRAGLPMNRITPLSLLVPSLTQPIYVATDLDAATELPRWQTGVLVPFVEPQPASTGAMIVSQPKVHANASIGQQVITRAEQAPSPFASFVAPQAPSTPSQVEPIAEAALPIASAAPPYQAAQVRIDALEAALDELTTNQPQPQLSPPAQLSPERPITRRAVELPQNERVDHGYFGRRADVDEADVSIVVSSQTRKPLLAPLPELPLNGPRINRFIDKAAGTQLMVEEAAVVIIRRQRADYAPPGLAFAATGPTDARVGVMRRFLRTLTGH